MLSPLPIQRAEIGYGVYIHSESKNINVIDLLVIISGIELQRI